MSVYETDFQIQTIQTNSQIINDLKIALSFTVLPHISIFIWAKLIIKQLNDGQLTFAIIDNRTHLICKSRLHISYSGKIRFLSAIKYNFSKNCFWMTDFVILVTMPSMENLVECNLENSFKKLMGYSLRCTHIGKHAYLVWTGDTFWVIILVRQPWWSHSKNK